MKKKVDYQNYKNAVRAIAIHDFCRIRNYYFSYNIDDQRSNLVNKMWKEIEILEQAGEKCPAYEIDLEIERASFNY